MQHDVSHRLMDLPFTAGFVTRKILSPVHQLDVKVQSAEAGVEKRRKPYFRFDARAAFDVSMVTG